MSESRDHVVRAATEDGEVRVVAMRGTDLVGRAVAAQGARGKTIRPFGEVLVGAVLLREAIGPPFRFQISVEGSDRAILVADSHPDGSTRGLVSGVGRGGQSEFDGKRLVRFSLAQGRKGLAETQLVLGPGVNLAGGVVAYLRESNSFESLSGIGCAMRGDEVAGAGGFVVQRLPEAAGSSFEGVSERIRKGREIEIDSILRERNASPLAFVEWLLDSAPYELLGEAPVRFGCKCSFDRVLDAIAVLGREAIEEAIERGEPFAVTCEYCGASYRVAEKAMRSILERS